MTRSHNRPGWRWLRLLAPTALALLGTASRSTADRSVLLEISRPDPTEMEPQVRDQFEQSLRDLDEILASDDVSDADLAEVFGSTGQLFMLYDFVDSAQNCFLNAVSLAPNQFQWLYYLGVVQRGRGELDKARETLERALRIEPGDLPTLVRLGRVELEAAQLEAAQEHFQRVLGLNPRSAAAHYGLGRIAVLQEDFPTAIDHFETALAEQPGASTAHYQLGLAYREIGEIEKARTHLGLQGRTGVDFEDPLMQKLRELVRGSSLFVVGATRAKAAGEWEEAVTLFRLALAADPENNAARLALATTFMQAGDLAAATREIEQALALDPENLAGHYNLGTVLAQQGETARAIEHLEKAIEIDSDFEIAHINLAVILARQGELERAESHYAQALAVDPNDLEAHQQRAKLLLHLARPDEAVTELEWVVDEQPGSATNRLELARALGSAGRFSEAADSFGHAIEIEPDNVESHYGRALALLFAERYAEARSHLEQGTRQFPQNLPLRHLLARLLATCPEGALRDGPRSLQMAQGVMRSQPIPEYAETVAMAFAEIGNFNDATSVQKQIMTRLGANLEPATAERLQRNLDLYQQQQPVRAPWLTDR